MIKSIVFDVDDTIYDQQQPFRKALLTVFPEVAEADLHGLYIRFRHHSDETFILTTNGTWTLEYMRFFRINQSLQDFGYSEVSETQGTRFQKVYEEELEKIERHPALTEVFDYLTQQDIPLGIITNGPTDHQSKKIQQLQLSRWIAEHRFVISQSTGFQKPDREIFDLAAEQFGFDPAETLYVGDNFENDVLGAANGGWQAVWLNHRLREQPAGLPSTHLAEITRFEDLLPTLQKLLAHS